MNFSVPPKIIREPKILEQIAALGNDKVEECV